ncbi:MAG TPA: YigZ family protein [Prolixibacteraceae bacterium]|nr:YigZ family protein [Prolixibacteraceae bacterium]
MVVKVELNDTYKTIEAPSEGLFKDKGSKFISYAFPVASEDQVKEIVLQIRKEHFNARHHCYAYRLGYTGEKYRANDDGEPSGTAGRPIHGQLLSNDLTNVLIVVVRYFGGTLLGVSGLINAYKTAATEAIKNARIVTKIIELEYELVFDYMVQNSVMRIIKDEQLDVRFSSYELFCKLRISIRQNKEEELVLKFGKIDGVRMEKIQECG